MLRCTPTVSQLAYMVAAMSNTLLARPGKQRLTAARASCRPGRRGAHRNSPPRRRARALRRFVVDRKYGHGNIRPERPARGQTRDPANPSATREIDGQAVDHGCRFVQPPLGRPHGGQAREIACALWHRLGLGTGDLVARRRRRGRDPVQHAVARGPRGLRVTVWPAQFGRLRQRDKQGRLARALFARLLAEIGERSGARHLRDCRHRARASDKARGFRPCERVLDFERAHDLAQLGPRCDAHAAPAAAPPAS